MAVMKPSANRILAYTYLTLFFMLRSIPVNILSNRKLKSNFCLLIRCWSVYFLKKTLQIHRASTISLKGFWLVDRCVLCIHCVSEKFPPVNFKNRLRFEKITESLKVGTFLRHSVESGKCGGRSIGQRAKINSATVNLLDVMN